MAAVKKNRELEKVNFSFAIKHTMPFNPELVKVSN